MAPPEPTDSEAHPPGSDTELIPFGEGSFRRAVGWSYVTDGVAQVVTTTVTFVLAAILGPEDFGVVALALLFVLFIELVQRQGMGAAVIQRRDLERLHADSAFWIVVGMSLALTVASAGLSGWWADVNDTPQLRSVVIALSFMLPIHGLITIQEAMLTRDLNFRALAIRRNTGALVGGAAGVASAFAGWGVWALVTQQLTTVVIQVVALWAVSTWRPRFRFSMRHVRDLLGYSSGVFLSSIALFVTDRADALMTGIFFGPIAVGLYRFSARIVEQIDTIAVRPLPAVALPELARNQGNSALFASRVATVARLAALAMVPILGVVAGSAESVTGLLGSDWSDATRALQLICIVGAMRSIVMLNGPVLHALGHAHLTAALAWITAIVSTGSFVVVGVLLEDRQIDAQVVGMALSRVAVFCALVPFVTLPLLHRYARVRAPELLRAILPGWMAGIVATAVGLLVTAALPELFPLLRLAVVASCSSLAALTTLLVADAQLREVGAKARARVAVFRGSAPTD